MIPITALWLPILLSAVLVFIASSVIHMLLPYHRSDWAPVPGEDQAMEALRGLSLPPGDYSLPHTLGSEGMGSEGFRKKLGEGPLVFMTVADHEVALKMGPTMLQWFLYCLLVGIFPAYLAGRMLEPGAPYIEVFRLTGTVAFAAYAMGQFPRSIWYKQRWATTLKSVFDGLVYSALTAGVFGSLWP